MKKLRYSRRTVRSQEQPRPLEISIFAEQQALAKQGVITAPSGADAVIKALGDASPVTNTLAGVMRDALSAAVADKIAVVNLASRKVTIVPTGASVAGISGGAGMTLAGTITLDDPTKPTGPMTVTGSATSVGPHLEDIVSEVKPSLSVESLINKIEDEVIDPDGDIFGEDSSAIIIVDQAATTVKVYSGSTGACAALNGATLFAEDAEFVQTLVSAAGRQFGE